MAKRPPITPDSESSPIPTPDRAQQQAADPWLTEAGLAPVRSDKNGDVWGERRLTGSTLRAFRDVFLDWLSRRPHGITVELDPELASLRDGTVAGVVRLDVEESGVDWFDLSVGLDVSDVELTQAEIDLLLKSRGRRVRLPDKGWRRLDFQLSDEDEAPLADLGLEGPQAALYRAELKRARAMLLKAKTSSQLDKLRFNILTSLLRLRQICCHPALVGAGKPGDESAKLAALLDLLEPLVEEGHKVLVFSQFVEMLQLIRIAATGRAWPHLILTGQTEDRGTLVDQFQRTEGASIFLVSLKAGGFGLNLTAASYVVLFDPWWNPAVENQAIDRTHRIGQTSKVIAYRLLARDTIEEKIRQLQKQKSALASDILGEESFAKALTLDDFRFLLGGEPAAD